MYHPTIAMSCSIHKKLLLLLLVLFLPAFGVICVSGLDHRRYEIQRAKDNALLLAHSLTAQQEQIAGGTKQMLATLAKLPEVQKLDVEACNELFHELRNQYPYYSTMGVATPDGKLLANSPRIGPGGVNLSDRKHVKDAMRTLDFSVGEYIVGRVSKTRSLNYSYPVLDTGKNLIAIVIAGFKLDEYTRFLTKVHLPEGSSLTILDHKGVCLYREPEHKAIAAGEPASEDAFKRISGDSEQGTVERTGQDGVDRIYAFKQLRLRGDLSPYLYMVVGIAKDEVIRKANLEMLSNLSILGITTFLAIALSWFLGSFVFVKPIDRLLTATQRFGKGEMDARTGLSHTSDELGQLAKSFDDMASLLEMRSIERENARELLGKAEEKYRNIFENAPEGIYRSTPAGKYIEANPAFARIFGYDSPEELKSAIEDIGRQLYVHPEKRQECIRTVMERGTAIFEIQVRRKDGSIGWASNNVRVVRDSDGKISHFEGIAQDITKRVRMEEELRKSEENYRLLAENATDIISKHNPRGVFLYASPACRTLLGYGPEELIGRSVYDYSHPDDLEEVRRSFSIIPSKPVVCVVSYRMRRKDGSYTWFETTGKTICDPDTEETKEILVVSRDISKRKKMEEELIKARKLEATAILAGGIAHDFNNLLSTVLGNIEMAREDVEPGSSAFNLLGEAVKAALRASDLTKKFIVFSTGGTPNKEPVCLYRLIMDAASLALRNSNVECRYSLPDDLWRIEVDQSQMSQVFYNVILNAKEAMLHGGAIDILAENVEIGSEGTGLPQKEGRYVRLTVKDYGVGISQDNLFKIFDPYYSTKDRGTQKGMGMGLTVAYSVLKKHGGYIMVKSDSKSGTTVCIYLPAFSPSPGR